MIDRSKEHRHHRVCPYVKNLYIAHPAMNEEIAYIQTFVSLMLFSGIGARGAKKVIMYVWILHLWPESIVLSDKISIEIIWVINHSR